jgi:hypothetical protein
MKGRKKHYNKTRRSVSTIACGQCNYEMRELQTYIYIYICSTQCAILSFYIRRHASRSIMHAAAASSGCHWWPLPILSRIHNTKMIGSISIFFYGVFTCISASLRSCSGHKYWSWHFLRHQNGCF